MDKALEKKLTHTLNLIDDAKQESTASTYSPNKGVSGMTNHLNKGINLLLLIISVPLKSGRVNY